MSPFEYSLTPDISYDVIASLHAFSNLLDTEVKNSKETDLNRSR